MRSFRAATLRAPRGKQLGKDTRGAVYVEFLLVFIPIFTIFLGLVQASLMYAANLVVTHAANTAARAAAVVLDDDPANYSDDERGTVSSGDSGTSAMDQVGTFLEWAGLGGSSGGGGGGGSSSGNARMGAIRSAASLPLIAVSPSMESLLGNPTVYKAIGGSGADRALTGAAIYNRTAVAVSFPSGPRGTSYESEFGKNDDVTVRVTYMFHCAVPLVNRFMCDDVGSLRSGVPIAAMRALADGVASGAAGPGEIMEMTQRVRDARDRLTRASPGVAELDSGAESPDLAYLTALTGARFVILRSEATMPNHGANYEYASDSGGGE